MLLDTATPLSRRALVGGVLGALGATLANAVARPLRVAASDTSLDYVNDEDGNTVLTARSNAQGGFPSSGGGIGIRGHSASEIGVFGDSDTGIGVEGFSGSVGVRGESPAGRGGVFKGPKAPVRLLPSANATHPASGFTGDLFVDKHHRLWFCKGGSNWKQLA